MGKKKDAALHGLSKKERKALEAREAALAAELAEREKKAAKKAKKKSKGKKSKKGKAAKPTPVKTDALPDLPPAVADAVADAKAARKAKRAAKKSDAEVEPEYTDAEKAGIAALVDAHADIEPKRSVSQKRRDAKDDAKKSTRDEKIDPATGETRPEVIAEREAVAMKTRDELDAEIKARVQAKRAAREAEALSPEVERQQTHLREKREADRAAHPRDEAVPTQTAEEVETEHGREFAVGTSEITARRIPESEISFAAPSEAPKVDFEINGNGQYKIARPSDGKLVGYTRVTTYIGCLEDTTMLTKWKMRLLLEGVAAAEELGDDAFTARVRDLVHNRDHAIAKARKADRKGKLGVGELATYIDGAFSDFKGAMDALADEAFELGGGREKAQKGTDIHDLCAIGVLQGIDAVGEKLEAGEITPADLADVEAFLDALRRLGAKVIEVERVVANDELRVAGRLDYVVMVKLPGMARSTRVVLDLKTGRVDLGAGKIAMQLGQYADAVGYDLNTHEREDLKLNRTKALVVHLPAGTAKATVHVVDLGAARRGNKLAAEVRAWRNEGKKAIDLKVDVLEQIDAEASAE